MGKVDAITDQLQMMTSNGSALNVDQVKNTTQDLESVIDYATADRTVANSVVKVISNVLDADATSFGEVKAENSIHRRLSHLVRRIATETSLEAGEEFSLNTPNIILTTRTASDIANQVEFRSFPQSNSTVDVPVEAVRKARDNAGNTNVQFIAYSNSKLFRERDDDVAMSRFTPSNRQVFEVSFGNSTIQNLTNRVHYSVGKPLHGTWLCVFWNETGGIWSTEGMFTNQTDDVAFCQSDHMTAFSILLDPNPNNRLSPNQERTLSIISYIGSGLSVIGLILTIITYSLFKTLNRDRAGKLLLNLCVSLLMLNLSFLAGALRSSAVKQTPGTDYLCVTIAILTHYFLLTSLGWMCVEATHMYQLLVYVFATGETRFLIKRLVIAWGVPFLVVAITAAVRISSYSSTDEYCMLSPTNAYVYYIAFLGPMCLLLVVNTVVFAMVARILFQPHMASKIPIVPAKGSWGQRPPRVTWAQVRGAFTVMTLLGVAWVFGAFAVGPARVLFQYIFCILNSLQGALIFFVRCIHYPEARAAWMHLWRTGQRKRTRGTPSAQLVNTSSTASTFASGGGAGHQNTARSKILSCVTHFRRSTKRGDSTPVPQSTSNPVVTESEEKVEERTAPGDSEPTDPKAWVYGGPTDVAASEGTFMATLRQAPQTQKRRPSSPGSERLNLKEGRDTGWQYLDLQPEGILFIEDTDEEDSVTVAASTEARDRGGPPDGTGVSKTSDQGYFSAHSSPRANCKSEKMSSTKE